MLLIALRNALNAYIFSLKLVITFALCTVNYGFIHASTTPIPDATFEQALISLGIDTNGLNGNILDSDAFEVVTLSIANIGVTNLSGIEAFSSLKYFYAYNNNITIADFSQNPNLVVIDLENNLVSSLNVTNCVQLRDVYISSNALTTIDVTQNLDLRVLSCNLNNLSSIDVSMNVNLENFRCYGNNLSSIDVSNNTNLEYLFISSNNLTNLDISSNHSLNTLTCDNNNLSSLTLNNNTNLEYLGCSNNSLAMLDLSANTQLTRVLCNNNNLTSIDVSNAPNLFLFYTMNNQLETINLTNNSSLRFFRAENNDLNNVDIRNNTNNIITEFVATQNPNLTCVLVDNTNAAYLSNWQVDNSCHFVADENECQTLTIEEIENVDFSMFPNPASTHVNINLDVSSAQLKIYSIQGLFVKERVLNQGKNNIDVSDLSSGIYLVSIESVGKTITKKLIIQ